MQRISDVGNHVVTDNFINKLYVFKTELVKFLMRSDFAEFISWVYMINK